MGVTKGMIGSPEVAAVMTEAGVEFIADSRLENLQKIKLSGIRNTLVLIRTPSISQVEQVVEYADISFNSELDVIWHLSQEACRQNKIHRIVVMVDLGDLREGVLPEDMESVFKSLQSFKNIKPIGIASNFGCVGGVLPDQEKMDELSRIATALENRFNICFDLISGGNSANYSWVEQTNNVGKVNNLRVGEMIFTGCNTIDYEPVDVKHYTDFG